MSNSIESRTEHSVTVCEPLPYYNLTDAGKQIRLLKFLPSEGSDDIAFELDTFDIAAPPSYQAISYTWGDNLNSRTITLNNHRISVRDNCFWALWQAGHHAEHRYIWIDALCINQNDLQEKAYQVQMMGKIFSHAAAVLVSLGPDVENIRAMLSTITAVVDQLERMEDYTSSVLDTWLNSHDENEIRCLDDALRALSYRRYWKRVWIVQELMVAQNIKILCGSDAIDLTTLSKLLDWLHKMQRTWSPGFLRYHAVTGKVPPPDGDEYMWKIMSTLGHRKLPLRSIIWEYRRCACTNPLDKIYGFLHVIDWPEDAYSGDTKLHPDYSKSAYCLLADCLENIFGQSSDKPLDDWLMTRYLMDSLQVDDKEDNVRRLIAERRNRRTLDYYLPTRHASHFPCAALPLLVGFRFNAASRLQATQNRTLTAALYTHDKALLSPELRCWNQAMTIDSIMTRQSRIVGYLCEQAEEGDIVLRPPEPYLGPEHLVCLVVRETAERAVFRIIGYAAISPQWAFCRSQRELLHLNKEYHQLAMLDSYFEGAFCKEDIIAYTALLPPYNDEILTTPDAQRYIADIVTTSFTTATYSSYVVRRDFSEDNEDLNHAASASS